MRRISVTIVLVIDTPGEEADVATVIDSELDAGTLQDAINDHNYDRPAMQVVSAECTTTRARATLLGHRTVSNPGGGR